MNYTKGFHHIISHFNSIQVPHPESHDGSETYEQISFFTDDLTVLPLLTENILEQADESHDFEVNYNIFYNCDDQNYLITANLIS